MATDIGNAYLTIVPSIGDVQKQLEAQLGSIDLSKSGEELWDSVSRGIRDSLSSVALEPDLANQLQKLTEEVQTMVDGSAGALASLSATVAKEFDGIVETVSGSPVAAFVQLAMELSGPISEVVTKVSEIGATFSSVKERIAGLSSAFKAAGGGFSGLKAVLGTFISPVTLVVAALAVLAAGFLFLMATNEGFRDTVMGLVGSIGESLAPILDVVGQAVSNLITTVLPMLNSMLTLLLPVIGQICIVILELVAALAPIIAALVTELVPIIGTIIELVVLAAATILTAIVPVIAAILTAIQENMPMIQMIVTTVMNAIMAVIQTVWPLIQAIIETAMAIIQSVINIVTAAMAGNWQGVWEGILALVDTVWIGIQNIVGIAIGILQGAIGAGLDFIQGIWDGAWAAIGALLQGAWDGICSAVEVGISMAVGLVGGLPDQALSALGDIGAFLYNAGSDLIQGFINGITAAGDWVINTVRSLCDDALGAVKAFFGIASPSRVMARMGGYVGDGFAEGIAASAPSVVRAMDEVGADVAASAAKAASDIERSFTVEPDTMIEPFNSPSRQGSMQYGFAWGEPEASSATGAKIDELIGAVRQLHGSLGGIIAANAPSIGRRDFRRVVSAL